MSMPKMSPNTSKTQPQQEQKQDSQPESKNQSVHIEPFFHPSTFTIGYLLWCDKQNVAALIDPPLDFCEVSGVIGTEIADQMIARIKALNLNIAWLLETHAHADHLSAAQYIKKQIGGQTAIGKDITFAQQTFKQKLNLGENFATDGRQFDVLLKNGQQLPLGDCTIDILATPGHTNDSLTYVIDGNAFIGDTLFMPDSGTSRCDFPGGDAGMLYDSIAQIFALGDDTLLWMCHDYQPNGRQLAFKTTVAEQRANNIHLANDCSKAQFVEVRQTRDATLSLPKLIYPSIQVNIAAGQLPTPQNSGLRFIQIPLSGTIDF